MTKTNGHLKKKQMVNSHEDKSLHR